MARLDRQSAFADAKERSAPGPDLQFCNCGSFATCMPLTPAGEVWLAANVVDETRPLPIEHRYLGDVVLGARADGLVCHG